jgi:hypothetical protein
MQDISGTSLPDIREFAPKGWRLDREWLREQVETLGQRGAAPKAVDREANGR